MYILKKITFYHGYIYRNSLCLVFLSTVKVSIRNYTWTIRTSIDLEKDHFLSWLYIQDICMFCISIVNRTRWFGNSLELQRKSLSMLLFWFMQK